MHDSAQGMGFCGWHWHDEERLRYINRISEGPPAMDAFCAVAWRNRSADVSDCS